MHNHSRNITHRTPSTLQFLRNSTVPKYFHNKILNRGSWGDRWEWEGQGLYHVILIHLSNQFFILHSTMEFEDTHILLSSSLLWFDQSCGSFYADNKTTCDLRIQCTTVPRLLYTQNPLHPWYNLVWWGICWLVKIYKSTSTKFKRKTLTLYRDNFFS